MKSQHKLISVIIPVYNGEMFLAGAIQSVLDQNYFPIEIIVVDDGSTDNTQQLASQFGNKIIYSKKENGGVASARNKGLEIAQGEFISFIDADDLWAMNKIELQLGKFLAKPNVGIVIGFTQRIPMEMDVARAEIGPNRDIILLYSLGSTLISKFVFDKIGNFDETMLLSEDTDWFYRAMETNIQIELHHEIVQYYRFHQNNITTDKKRNFFYQLKAHKKSLNRRRKAGKGSVSPFPKPNNLDEMIKYWKTIN